MMPFRFQKPWHSGYYRSRHVFFPTDEPYLQFRRNVFYPKSKEQQVLVPHMLRSIYHIRWVDFKEITHRCIKPMGLIKHND